jgi:hypothetical protein
MRAYFVDGMPAAEVSARFGYSAASVRQMATLLRSGRMRLFNDRRDPGAPERRIAATRERGEVTANPCPRAAWPSTAWPAGTEIESPNAGLLLLFPAVAEMGLDRLVAACGLPASAGRTAWQALAPRLVARCARGTRATHEDDGLSFALGLTERPAPSDFADYARHVPRSACRGLLAGMITELRRHGLAGGKGGFNLGLYPTSRRGSGALVFCAQDHEGSGLVYTNARASQAGSAGEVIAFADYWLETTGCDPELLVFDAGLGGHTVLNGLSRRRIRWLTPRSRGRSLLARLATLPDHAWRGGRVWEETVALRAVGGPVRQIAVRDGRYDKPTVLITNDPDTPAEDLLFRYGERSVGELEMVTTINDMRLAGSDDADLDLTLAVIAENLVRTLVRDLPEYRNAEPDALWWDLLSVGGVLSVHDDSVTVTLERGRRHPSPPGIGLDVSVPWWDGRRLRYRFR